MDITHTPPPGAAYTQALHIHAHPWSSIQMDIKNTRTPLEQHTHEYCTYTHTLEQHAHEHCTLKHTPGAACTQAYTYKHTPGAADAATAAIAASHSVLSLIAQTSKLTHTHSLTHTLKHTHTPLEVLMLPQQLSLHHTLCSLLLHKPASFHSHTHTYKHTHLWRC